LVSIHRHGINKRYIYFGAQDEDHDVAQLFLPGTENTEDKPLVHFLHPDYTRAVSVLETNCGRTWPQWLEDCVGVQRVPQLLDETGVGLSREFKFILEARPGMLVPLLKRYWKSYESQVATVENEIREFTVPVEGDEPEILCKTFVPLPRLERIIDELHIDFFPFLRLPKQPKDRDLEAWSFIERFGVGLHDGIGFYMRALDRIAETHDGKWNQQFSEALFKVYQGIEEQSTTPEDRTHIQYVILPFKSL
jgi:hypothetical protein